MFSIPHYNLIAFDWYAVLIVLGDRGFAALDCSVIHTVGTFMPEPMGMQISADRKGCQGNIVLLALRSLRKFPEGSTKDYLQANWFSPMNQMQLLNLAKVWCSDKQSTICICRCQ